MKTMTSRERMMAAFRGGEVDYTPCCPAFWTSAPDYQAFKWRDVDDQLDHVMNKLGADARLGFGFDAAVPTTKTWTETPAGEDYTILHSTIDTPKGELHASIRKTEDYPHADVPVFSDWTVSRYVEPWLQSMEDVEKLASVCLPPGDADLERGKLRLEETRRTADRWGIIIAGNGGSALNRAIHSMGAEQGVLMSVDQPEVVEALLDCVYKRQTRELEMMLELGIDVVIRNGWYDSTDFWSPAQFEAWVMPQLRKDISAVHEAGGVFIYQMCTGVKPLLPYLAQLDFDCLLEFEPALGQTESTEAKAALPGKTFWGGVSAPVHIEGGDEQTTRAAVRNAFEAFGNRGLILKAVPSIRAHLPKENIAAFFDEWKKLRA